AFPVLVNMVCRTPECGGVWQFQRPKFVAGGPMAKQAKTKETTAKRAAIMRANTRRVRAGQTVSTQATNAPAAGTKGFDDRLDRLAEIAVRVGLRLTPGQELVMTAPVEALPLARRITAHAYKAGA